MGGRKEEAVSVHAISGGSVQKIATREVEKVIIPVFSSITNWPAVNNF